MLTQVTTTRNRQGLTQGANRHAGLGWAGLSDNTMEHSWMIRNEIQEVQGDTEQRTQDTDTEH